MASANVLTVVSLISLVNGLLTWIGKGFGFHALTLQLILRYVFYPVTFFVGVPRNEILRVAELLATKLIENEFVGYTGASRSLLSFPSALPPAFCLSVLPPFLTLPSPPPP